jgi:hypothetical protein
MGSTDRNTHDDDDDEEEEEEEFLSFFLSFFVVMASHGLAPFFSELMTVLQTSVTNKLNWLNAQVG